MDAQDFWIFGLKDRPGGGHQVAWLTSRELGSCVVSPLLKPVPALPALREGVGRVSLETVWPPELVAALSRHAKRQTHGARIRIRMCLGDTATASADTGWSHPLERAAIEYMFLDHRRLDSVANVDRCASGDLDGTVSTKRSTLFLSLWFPRKKGAAALQIAASPHFKPISNVADVESELKRNTDLRSYSALFLLAHGDPRSGATRSPGSGPFWVKRHPDPESPEEPWNGLQGVRLPPLVMILACAGDDYDLFEYGRSLLSDSTRCVVVPIGKIDAPLAAQFVSEFTALWRDGNTIQEAMDALRAGYKNHTLPFRRDLLDRLWLLGDGDLRHGDGKHAPPLSQLTAEELRTGSRRSPRTRAALLDRATLLSVRQTGSLHGAVRQSTQLFQLDPTMDKVARRHMRALDSAFKYTAPITKAWLSQYLTGLGERYDHPLMRRYGALRLRDQSLSLGVPILFDALTSAHYREGRWVAGAECLKEGLKWFAAPVRRSESSLERFALVGWLCNYLLDFNLPKLAEQLAESIEREAARMDGDTDIHFFRFTLLDRLSRAAFRQGQFEKAYELMKHKYAQATEERGDDGGRELAWLIYIAAWGGRELRASVSRLGWLKASFKIAEQSNEKARREGRGRWLGNENSLYLLRAWAAWYWAGGQSAAVTQVLKQSWPSVRQHLDGTGDRGPPGFVVGYLAAAGNPAARRCWKQASEGMLVQKYLIEMVGLSLLFDRRSDGQVRKALEEFQRTRNDIVAFLGPAISAELPHWPTEVLADYVAGRTRRELEILTESVSLQPQARRRSLIAAGMLPL